jgi:hypothetical protein
MSLSQSYSKGYDSVLYPGGTNANQETILPKIPDSGMGGNSAAYTSNKVGGGISRRKRTKCTRSKNGRSKCVRSKRILNRRRHRKTKRT